MTTGSRPPSDPLRSAFEHWGAAALSAQALWARVLGPAAILAAGQARFDSLTRLARERSKFYRRAWKHLPQRALRLAELPVVAKHDLMAAFDDWCIDPSINRAAVDAFLADRGRIGELFLDRYVVWMSSGTSGEPGVFVQDSAAMATYDAMSSAQLASAAFAGSDWRRTVAQSGRAVLITADANHFASIASWRRTAGTKPWLDMKSIAVTQPLSRIVDELNAYQPAFVSSYPTVLALLAQEQTAGRLAIRPSALWAGGEGLSLAARRGIEQAFGCPVQNEYGASECLTIAHACREGWLHINADWLILEPVDRDHRATLAGQLSHTVLLTNLANSVQPIIRYDLGDSIRALGGRCACGSPLPAIQVEGRSDDVLRLRRRDGTYGQLVPLALTTVVEEAASIHRFQIIQLAEDRLGLRLMDTDRARAGGLARAALRGYLERNALSGVEVLLESGEPQPQRHSGKLRQVVATPSG